MPMWMWRLCRMLPRLRSFANGLIVLRAPAIRGADHRSVSRLPDDTVVSFLVGRRAGKAAALGSLLKLGVDEILKREDLVPFLLGEELLLLHDNVVEALTRLVAFPGNLGALLVPERGFQHRHDAQGIEHHVARAFGVRSDALDAVHPQAR